MITHLPYNDAPWKRKAHKPEAGYRIRHFTTACQYSGALTETWVVRCPVTNAKLAEAESEDKARQRAREIAAKREGLAA